MYLICPASKVFVHMCYKIWLWRVGRSRPQRVRNVTYASKEDRYSTIFFALILTIFLSGCKTPTPISQSTLTKTSAISSTKTSAISSPTPIPKILSHPSFPSVYIAIDESGSVWRDDCDPNYYRYKLPLFLLKVFKSVVNEFKPKDGPPTSVSVNLILVEGGQKDKHLRLIQDDEAINKIKDLLKNPSQRNFPNHPFVDVFKKYENILKSQNSPAPILFFFTDGDFTGSPEEPENVAEDVKGKFSFIKQNFPEAKMYFFLLCFGRFSKQDSGNEEVKSTWNYIYGNAKVFGINQDKMIANDEQIPNFLKQLFDTVFEDQGWKEDPNSLLSGGWGFLEQAKGPFALNIPPAAVRLRFEAIAFDEKNETKALIDGSSLSEDSFLPPAKDCGMHELRISNYPALTFYWWHADVPQLFLSEPIVFHNFVSEPIFHNGQMEESLISSWTGESLPSSNFGFDYFKCMKFQARVEEEDWRDFDSIIALENLPDRLDNSNLQLRSIWNWEKNGLIYHLVTYSSDVPAEMRFFPEFKDLKINSCSFNKNTNIEFELVFEFLDSKYYPSEKSYQPRPSLSNTPCQTKEVPIQDFCVFENSPSGLKVKLVQRKTDWRNHVNFVVDWESPDGNGWKASEEIRVSCTLFWDYNETKLDKIECEQKGGKKISHECSQGGMNE